jgi:uncharacterized protein (TIGR03067 family)
VGLTDLRHLVIDSPAETTGSGSLSFLRIVPMPISCGIVAIALCLAPADGNGDRPNTDRESIQGSWRVITAEADGKSEMPTRNGKAVNGKYVFKGNKMMCIEDDKNGEECSFILAAANKAKTIDLHGRQASGEVMTVPGIYRIEKDTLIICFGRWGKRPTSFGGSSEAVQFQLKRE